MGQKKGKKSQTAAIVTICCILDFLPYATFKVKGGPSSHASVTLFQKLRGNHLATYKIMFSQEFYCSNP